MRRLAVICSFLMLTAWCGICSSQQLVFEGPWKTTNRKLDGIMTCVVTPVGDEQWKGRFYGVWQGVPFDYTVAFSGPPSSLKGTAVIDGADYDWTGEMVQDDSAQGPSAFKARFGGSRYAGYFDMKAKGRER
jgi:hypothetical protein